MVARELDALVERDAPCEEASRRAKEIKARATPRGGRLRRRDPREIDLPLILAASELEEEHRLPF